MFIRERASQDGTTWQLIVSVGSKAQGYRRVTRTVGPFPGQPDRGRRKAEEAWRKLKGEVGAQTAAFVEPSNEKLAAFMESWLERKRAEVRPTTWEVYGKLTRLHVIPGLGHIPLVKLSPRAVQDWVDGLAKSGLSPRFVAACRTILRIALQDALRLGQVQQNVVDRTRGPRQTKRKVEAFTREEMDAILSGMGARWKPLFAFAAYSGLRRGEFLALKWGDVDFKRGAVSVRRSLVVVNSKAVLQDDTKTEAGTRRFVLPAAALNALRLQKKLQAEDRLSAGPAYEDGGFIFANHLGGVLRPDNLRRELRTACKRAGIEPKPIHALRHTAASFQLAAGVPLEVVSKRLGHKSRAVTADIYGHLMPESDQDAAAKMDAFLDRQGGA